MKAVVFAGGAATRLARYIGSYNKHLIPLGKTLVIERGIHDLLRGGATQIYLITNHGWEDEFQSLLRNKLKIRGSCVTVVSSNAPSLPLPDVLLLAKDFIGTDSFLLYLGDNLFLNSPVPLIRSLIARGRANTIVLSLSNEPSHFGVVRFRDYNGHHHIRRIEEKPNENGYRWVVSGLAKYTPEVFDIAQVLAQSMNRRRSLSDLHNVLIREQKLQFVAWPGLWFDVGTSTRYFRSLDGIWTTSGQLQFDLNICPRAELLKGTRLAEMITQFTWEKAHEKFE